MAVTIEKRPIGVVLDTCVTASINQDYSSIYATVNKTSHGLSDGNYVYIQSNVENYNGFWKIEVTNANEFILIDNPYVEWIVDADITYCPQVATHGWSCVHLPIVYELGNTRFPVNSVDTARTISSISDDNGYVNLNLSGSLGTFEDLAFIKISSASDSDFDGVYQIIDKLSTSDVTINLAYSSVTASGLVGATIQLYYSNYNIVVKVYAGINATHTWTDQKPYELAATLELIPDADNKVKFSINEILKGYVQTENNLLLATLPNNIDAWTQFYIEVAEQYDTSDGYTVTTFKGAFASDQSEFEGYAVNSILHFKNIHSGYLSEYIMTNTTAKFLTLFAIPVLFSCGEDTPDCYQDISFIVDDTFFNPVALRQSYYSNGVFQTFTDVAISGGGGIYRVPLTEADCSYDRVDVNVRGQEVFSNPTMDSNLTGWTNEGGYDGASTSYPWTYDAGQAGAENQIDILNDTPVNSNRLSHPYFKVNTGSTGVRTFSYIVRWDNSGISVGAVDLINFNIEFYKSNTLVASATIDDIAGSPNTDMSGSYDSPDIDFDEVRLSWEIVPVAGSFEAQLSFYIKEFYASVLTGSISETKQFEIDCGCSNQEIRLSWLNNLGGFDYWTFTGETEHSVDISNSGETKTNIFPQWPKSYGEHADTIRKQTFRDSRKREFIYSQYLTQEEADAIAFIKSSPLVQIVNSRQDRRTVIVDTDSFTKYKDGDKTYSISFNIFYTDDLPSQRV